MRVYKNSVRNGPRLLRVYQVDLTNSVSLLIIIIGLVLVPIERMVLIDPRGLVKRTRHHLSNQGVPASELKYQRRTRKKMKSWNKLIQSQRRWLNWFQTPSRNPS